MWQHLLIRTRQPGLFQTVENLIFITDCPRCNLQVIRSVLDVVYKWCPYITTLYWPVCMSYCGNDERVGMCAGEQLYNAEVWQRKNGDTSSHYSNTCAVYSRYRTLPQQTDSMEQTDEHYNVSCCSHGGLYCTARGLCRIQRTVEDMSSLGHLMKRGGMQIFECTAGHLWGSVAV